MLSRHILKAARLKPETVSKAKSVSEGEIEHSQKQEPKAALVNVVCFCFFPPVSEEVRL